MAIAGIVLLFVGLILVISYPINKKNVRCTAQTQGELVKIRQCFDSQGPKKSAHVYAYQVYGVEYRLDTVEHSPQAERVGDECTIWYNPDRLQDAQAYRGPDKYLKTLLIVGLVLLPLGLVVSLLGLVL